MFELSYKTMRDVIHNMAAYITSQCSSLAPTDFKLTTSFDDGNGAISVAVEKCQLCTGSRRPFFCKECVRRGDFTHSRARVPERYTEKLKRWQAVKKERAKLLERIETAVLGKLESDSKTVEAQNVHDRINLLKDAIQDVKEKYAADKETVEELKSSNASRRSKAGKHQDKKKRICQYISHIQRKTGQQRELLLPLLDHLSDIRRRHLADLIRYIFTITEVQPKSSETDPMTMSTVSALAEARRTSYIRGRWVYTDNGSEQQYQVVEPCLPGSGDYSAYSLWISENKEALSSPESEISQRNPAHTISAALAHTAQLLSIISYFLSVKLPRRQCYSEFCGSELSESQFRRAVNKLNQNVLYLCFTQNVDPDLLNSHHTIHNVLMLLQAQQLGRDGWFEVNSELMLSLDEGEEGSEEEDLSNSDEEEVDTGERDWEHVPVTLPDLDVAGQSMAPYMSVQVESQRPGGAFAGTGTNTATAAGGLMSSAAASMASLWRAATSRKDK